MSNARKTRMREKREASARKTRDNWLTGEREKNVRGKQSDAKREKEINNLPLIWSMLLGSPCLLVLSFFWIHCILYKLTIGQCSYFSAEHVDSRIDAFLDEFGEILRSQTDDDFKSQVNNYFRYIISHDIYCTRHSAERFFVKALKNGEKNCANLSLFSIFHCFLFVLDWKKTRHLCSD